MSDREIEKLIQELKHVRSLIARLLLTKPPDQLSKFCAMSEDVSNICASEDFIAKYSASHTKEIRERTKPSDVAENHSVLYEFFQTVGGDLFIRNPNDTLNGPWIIEMDSTYYDENGPLRDIRTTGKNISRADLKKYVVPCNSQKFDVLKGIYWTYAKEAHDSILEQLKAVLNYTELSVPFPDYDGRVYMIRYEGELRILRIFDPGEIAPSSPDEIVDIHRLFSEKEICPHVYASGILYPAQGGQAYVYIVMDYIPMTLRSIPNKQTRLLVMREAIKVAYKIQALGYYEIDNHAGNFLYDPETNKVYAIDFGQLTKTATKNNKFDGKIRDMFADGEILDG